MATKKVETKPANGVMEFGHKVLLAYVGAFGVMGDKLGEWFEMFVERGHVMEKDARKMVKQNEKQARKFAADLQKQEKTAVRQAEKTVKKAVKKVEALA